MESRSKITVKEPNSVTAARTLKITPVFSNMRKQKRNRRQLEGRLAAESENQLPEDRVDPGSLTISELK